MILRRRRPQVSDCQHDLASAEFRCSDFRRSGTGNESLGLPSLTHKCDCAGRIRPWCSFSRSRPWDDIL
jgi:hypothetical protein